MLKLKANVNIVDQLVELHQKGELKIPLSKSFSPVTPDKAFANLKAYDNTALEVPDYKLKSYYPKLGLYKDNTYLGRHVVTQNRKEDADTVNILVDFFTEEQRLKAKRYDQKLSPWDAWFDKDAFRALIQNLLKEGVLKQGQTEVSYKDLRQALYLYGEANLFFCTRAKMLVELLYGNKTKGVKWLDISAGWGDRLLTAIALDMDYEGYDPNTSLIDGHQAIIKKFGDSTRHYIYPKPFEEAEIKEGLYDLVLTSPPFFDVELYSTDVDQSVNKYPTFIEWMQRFMFPALKKAWSALKLGGYMVLYIGDPAGQTPGIPDDVSFTEACNLYVESLNGASWQGVVGSASYNPTGRYNYRPAWIWQKSNNPVKWEPDIKREIHKSYPQLFVDIESKPFKRTDLYLTSESQKLGYVKNIGHLDTVHWGQRKLLMTEIWFLTTIWNPKEVKKPIVVYAGAAPGIHTPFLSKMFPEVEFHLYDPGQFEIKETDNIKLYQQLFTEKEVEQWAKISERDKNVFVWSDIRSRQYLKTGDDQSEREIADNMNMQADWVKKINPVSAMLKMRLPYPNSYRGQGETFSYLQGYVMIQPWAPQKSTETRLVPIRNKEGKYFDVDWDNKDYESRMFYHNIINRRSKYYIKGLNEPNQSFDGGELLNDWDGAAEVQILSDYLLSRGSEVSRDRVVALSRAVTANSGSIRGQSTLSGLRSIIPERYEQEEGPKTKKHLKFDQAIIDAAKQYHCPFDYEKFSITKASRYSSLMPWHIKPVSNAFNNYFGASKNKIKRIVDATSHVGCDLSLMAYIFPDAVMTAIEVDKATYQLLETNMVRLFEGKRQIQTLNDDIVGLLKGNFYDKVDLLYMDPPWGGPDYKEKKELMLYLSEVPVYDVVNMAFKKGVQYIVLKVPANFSMSEFQKNMKCGIKVYSIYKSMKTKEISYNLLFINRC